MQGYRRPYGAGGGDEERLRRPGYHQDIAGRNNVVSARNKICFSIRWLTPPVRPVELPVSTVAIPNDHGPVEVAVRGGESELVCHDSPAMIVLFFITAPTISYRDPTGSKIAEDIWCKDTAALRGGC